MLARMLVYIEQVQENIFYIFFSGDCKIQGKIDLRSGEFLGYLPNPSFHKWKFFYSSEFGTRDPFFN